MGTLLAATLTFLLLCAGQAFGQLTFNNVASTVISGFDPMGAVADRSGNVYVLDNSNSKLFKVDSQGVATEIPVIYGGTAMSSPMALAMDAAENLYIADNGNARVVKVLPGGGTELVVDGAVSIDGAHFGGAQGVAVAADGMVYVADSNNNRILAVSPSHVVSVLPISGLAVGLSFPRGLALDGSGNLYIGDQEARIVKVTPAGAASVLTINGLTQSLGMPASIALDSVGNLYIADFDNNRIVKVAPSGAGSVLSTGQEIVSGPTGVAVDRLDKVYISNFSSKKVLRIQQAVDLGHLQIGSGSATSILLGFKANGSLSLDSFSAYTEGVQSGDFIVATHPSNCHFGTASPGSTCTLNIRFAPTKPGLRRGVLKIGYSISGTPYSLSVPLYGTGIAPMPVLSPGTASVISSNPNLNAPQKIAVDGSGKIYVANGRDNNVVAISGSNESLVSTAPYTLSSPADVAVDGAGNLFIADYVDNSHSRILEVSPTGAISRFTITGMTQPPQNLALDPAGNLYILLTGSGKILKVKPPEPGAGDVTLTGTLVNLQGYTFAWGTALGMAVDREANIYVADHQNNVIVRITPEGLAAPFPITGATLDRPQGLTFDGMGNLYVASYTRYNAVVRVSTTGVASPLRALGPTVSFPGGTAVDSNGNVFIPDNQNNRVVKVDQSTLAVAFADTPVGSTSTDSPMTVAVTNLGNADLQFTATPAFTTDFPENAALNVISSSTKLIPGGSADFSANFTPQSGGTKTATMSLAYNKPSIVPGPPQITLSGKGLVPDATAVAVTPTPASVKLGEPVTFTISVANTAEGQPSGTPTGYVTLTDAVGDTTVSLNGGAQVPLNSGVATLPVTLTGVGTHTITASYPGVSQLFDPSQNTATITVNKADATIVGPVVQPVWVIPGDSARVLLRVDGVTEGGAPTGTVSYDVINSSAVSTSSGTAVLSPANISGTATLELPSTIPSGRYTISIRYAGDSNYAASATPLNVLVTVATTPTITWAQPAALPYGSNLSGVLNASASSNGSPVAGTYVYATMLADGSGMVLTPETVLQPGEHTLMLLFTPDDQDTYTTAVASVTLTVNKLSATITSPTASPIQLTFGQYGSIDLVVTGAANSPVPTGQVRVVIQNNANPLHANERSVYLTPGSTNATARSSITNGLAVGTYTVTFTYMGDEIYAPVTSPNTIALEVKPVVPTIEWAQPAAISYGTSLSGILNASAYGLAIIDDVRPVGSGPQNISRTVPGSFVYTATATGGTPVAVTEGTVLQGGNYTLTAAFTPTDTVRYTAASGSVMLTVNKIASTVTLSSSANPSLAGHQVVFTATAPPQGTGAIDFYDGTTRLGSVALTQGAATYATSALAAGTHSITASYAGDTNFTSATSPVVSQTVNRATPTITLTSSANPALITTAVSFTVAVTPQATGSVTLYDGSTPLGTVSLNQGAAVYNTSSLSVGTHSITATYAGDSNFLSATSSAIAQVVNDFTVTPGTGGSGGTGAVDPVPTQTISRGGTATFPLSIAPTGGGTLPVPVTLTVTHNLPPGSTATLLAGGLSGTTLTLPAGSSLTSAQLQVFVPSNGASPQLTAHNRINPLSTMPFALGFLLLPFGGKLGQAAGKRAKRSGMWLVLGLVAVAALVGLSGCGAVNSGYSAQQDYTITVTATSGSVSHSTTFNLTVR